MANSEVTFDIWFSIIRLFDYLIDIVLTIEFCHYITICNDDFQSSRSYCNWTSTNVSDLRFHAAWGVWLILCVSHPVPWPRYYCLKGNNVHYARLWGLTITPVPICFPGQWRFFDPALCFSLAFVLSVIACHSLHRTATKL